MFTTFSLGRLFGIPLTAHWTLLFLATYLLSVKYRAGGVEAAAMEFLFLVGIFGSILAHEMGHVLMARLYGVKTKSINLSPIGGIAFLDRYPDHPGGKIAVALAGPAVSLVLSVVFWLWAYIGYGPAGLDTPVGTLWFVNTLLLVFNLLPIYPMDGGQVCAALVAKFGGEGRAKKVSLYSGQAGGSAMMAYGLYSGTLSFVLIGLFIFAAVSVEFESPLLNVFRSRKKREQAAREPVQRKRDAERGIDLIFVAFDATGRHYAYAKHWLNVDEEHERDQMMTVMRIEREAERKGGSLEQMSHEDYRRLIAEAA